MSSGEQENSLPKEKIDSYRTSFYVDYVAGCLGGVMGTIVGQPFDTVKVRLQTEGRERLYKNGMDCAKHIIKKEGIYGLFKGLTPPIAGQAGINAVIFGVQGTVMRFMNPGLKSELISGVLAGGAQTLIICPVELIKTKLQVQGRGILNRDVPNFKGPLEIVTKMVREEGIFSLYKGMGATLVRDLPAFGVYFGLYYSLMKYLTPEGKTAEDISPLQIMFAGGLTGVASWVYSYPSDVIKSKVQAEGFAPNGRYMGYLHCIRTSIREEGYLVFTRGITVCLSRAFPVNAATFAAVEASLGILDPRRKEKFLGWST